jgi:GTP-binding protein HflX
LVIVPDEGATRVGSPPSGGLIHDVSGKTLGLKQSQLKRLQATFRRRVRASEVTSPELARHLTEISRETGRQIGVLLNRRGEIEHVIVGDAFRLEFPDIGRARAGDARLRGLRLVHTHLKDEPLTRDDLTDLALLRLDLICAIETRPDGLPGKCYVGYLNPDQSSASNDLWETESAEDVYSLDLDPVAKAEELESAFGRAIKARPVTAAGRAILVSVVLHGRAKAESSMAELKELARTAGVDVIDVFYQARDKVDSRYVIGEGKLDELNLRSMQVLADMLIFDHDLSPSQSRHLADHTSLKVLDRTQLILDIFAQRAQSADGKLQVELAQLKYMLPRLTQQDDSLSRLAGGIGGRGPGETKLENDRRRVRDRISVLEKRVDALGEDRQIRRQKRERQSLPVISIVGYTNAGKSTLLNALTNANVLAENKLFATLDTTSRRLRFPRDREVIITDTVGFIRALPKTLLNAFRATLEELAEADLLVHVVDASDPEQKMQIEAVETILASLKLSGIPRLLVFNKCDRLEGGIDGVTARAIAQPRSGVAISATTGAGFPELLERAEALLWREGKVQAPASEPFEPSSRPTAMRG